MATSTAKKLDLNQTPKNGGSSKQKESDLSAFEKRAQETNELIRNELSKSNRQISNEGLFTYNVPTLLEMLENKARMTEYYISGVDSINNDFGLETGDIANIALDLSVLVSDIWDLVKVAQIQLNEKWTIKNKES